MVKEGDLVVARPEAGRLGEIRGRPVGPCRPVARLQGERARARSEGAPAAAPSPSWQVSPAVVHLLPAQQGSLRRQYTSGRNGYVTGGRAPHRCRRYNTPVGAAPQSVRLPGDVALQERDAGRGPDVDRHAAIRDQSQVVRFTRAPVARGLLAARGAAGGVAGWLRDDLGNNRGVAAQVHLGPVTIPEDAELREGSGSPFETPGRSTKGSRVRDPLDRLVMSRSLRPGLHARLSCSRGRAIPTRRNPGDDCRCS